MPVDPSIFQNVQNFNDLFAKDQAIAAATQAQQTEQQLNKYRLATAKSDFEDQQNLKAAYRQAGGDPTQTLAIAAKLGVSPKSITAFQAQQLEIRDKLATLNKTETETDKSKLDILNERQEHVFNAAQPLTQIKDPAEFAARLPNVIQQQLAQGNLTQDEAKAAAGMNQQQLIDHLNGIANTKAHTDYIKAQTDLQNAGSRSIQAQAAQDRQKNEDAKQKADAVLAQRSQAAASLTAAYTNGGPLAYSKTLATIDPVIAAYSPAADKVAALPMGAAIKLIGQGAMTAEQFAQQQHNDAILAEQSDYHAKELKLRQQSANIQQQMLGLDTQKTQAVMFSAGLGSDGKPVQGAGVDQLKTQTQNTSDGRLYVDEGGDFSKLPKGQQMQVRTAANQAGVPLLNAKEAASVKDVDNARNTINSVFTTFMQHAGAGATAIPLKPLQAVGNYLGAASGVLPDLDAARKNFLGAIETMKSAGGQGSGLRITGAEIQRVGSMMPSLGDTQEQLKEKAKQINTLVNDKLNSGLHSVPITSGTPNSAPSGNVATMSDIQRIAKQHNVSIDEVANEYRKKGWTVK